MNRMEKIRHPYGSKDGEYFLWPARFFLDTIMVESGASLIIGL